MLYRPSNECKTFLTPSYGKPLHFLIIKMKLELNGHNHKHNNSHRASVETKYVFERVPISQLNINCIHTLYSIHSRRFFNLYINQLMPYNQTTQNRLSKILFSEFSFHSASVRYFLSSLSVTIRYGCSSMFLSGKEGFSWFQIKEFSLLISITKYHSPNVWNIKIFM